MNNTWKAQEQEGEEDTFGKVRAALEGKGKTKVTKHNTKNIVLQ